jgi:hypothetical protein
MQTMQPVSFPLNSVRENFAGVSTASTIRPLPLSARLGSCALAAYDAALGVSEDAWTAQFYGQNITDTRGKVFISDSQAIETETVIRPRVLGLRFSYRF